jgi:hypothetical protein
MRPSRGVGDTSLFLLPRIPLVVVSGFLTLAVIGFGTWWIYDTRLAPTHLEEIWLQSQRGGSGPNAVVHDAATQIQLQRSRCYGSCPAYTVTVFGTGRVEFNGEDYACVLGTAETNVDPADVQRLVDGLAAVGYDRIGSFTSHDSTDHPTVIVTLRTDGRSHTVNHYLGDNTAPRLLRMIEERIDAVASTGQWLGVWDSIAHSRVCTTPDGYRTPIRIATPANS